MLRPLCISFACLLILASPAFAETDGEVYEETDRIFAQATEEVGDNLANFIEANERPLARARTDLAALIRRMNEEKRPDVATALQKRLNTLEETVQKRASAKVPVIQPQKKPLLERMAGEWVNPSRREKRTFTLDGNFGQTKGDQPAEAIPQSHKVEGEKYLCKLDNGHRFEAWLIDDDRIAFLWYRPDGSFIGDGEVWLRKK